MKSKITTLLFALPIIMLFSACTSEAQNTNQTAISTSDGSIEIIQFHSEHRCMTCNKIEEFTKETLTKNPNVAFSLVNVDDKNNDKMAEQFEAAGTALFLYDPKTGVKKDLTDFAFMNAGDKAKFMAGLQKEINQFIN